MFVEQGRLISKNIALLDSKFGQTVGDWQMFPDYYGPLVSKSALQPSCVQYEISGIHLTSRLQNLSVSPILPSDICTYLIEPKRQIFVTNLFRCRWRGVTILRVQLAFKTGG